MPPENRDAIVGSDRKPQTSAEASLEEMFNTTQADVRSLRRDMEQLQNLLSRATFDEAGRPMNQVETQLSAQGRWVRAEMNTDAKHQAWVMGALMALIGALGAGLTLGIITSHHWLGT